MKLDSGTRLYTDDWIPECENWFKSKCYLQVTLFRVGDYVAFVILRKFYLN